MRATAAILLLLSTSQSGCAHSSTQLATAADDAQIRGALASHGSALEACFANEAKTIPDLRRHLKVSLSLLGHGRAKIDVESSEADLPLSVFGYAYSCVSQTISKIEFPMVNRGLGLRVAYPLTFSAMGSDSSVGAVQLVIGPRLSWTAIAAEPEFDVSSVRAAYPDGPARALGIEGDTVMRVHLDATGKVESVRVLNGVGHGLDDYAVMLLKTQARFSPARDADGNSVPYDIAHTIHWEMDRSGAPATNH